MQTINRPHLKWNILFVAIAAAVVTIDQLSKLWIRNHLALYQSMPPDGPFRLTYAQNTGAAFSVFYGNAGILTVVSIIGIILLLTYAFVIYRRFPYLDTLINKISLAMILGGTAGNLIDRLHLGHVTDFINVSPWPVFNVADSSIVAGVIIFALSILLSERDTQSEFHQ